jgi:hypothetical protein
VPLRRVTIILPCLEIMTFVVGQLNESRQLNAFVPVFAAMICAWLGHGWGTPGFMPICSGGEKTASPPAEQTNGAAIGRTWSGTIVP